MLDVSALSKLLFNVFFFESVIQEQSFGGVLQKGMV